MAYAPDKQRLDDMVSGYLGCLVWVGLDWSNVDDVDEHNPIPLDENYGVGDISPEALAEIRTDVKNFAEAEAQDLVDYASLRSWGDAGHDFCLTRNRHGAGFWDRGLGALGDRLSEAARVYGIQDLQIGDDGKLYV